MGRTHHFFCYYLARKELLSYLFLAFSEQTRLAHCFLYFQHVPSACMWPTSSNLSLEWGVPPFLTDLGSPPNKHSVLAVNLFLFPCFYFCCCINRKISLLMSPTELSAVTQVALRPWRQNQGRPDGLEWKGSLA